MAASMTEKLNFQSYLILIDLNSYTWLMATLLDSEVLEHQNVRTLAR